MLNEKDISSIKEWALSNNHVYYDFNFLPYNREENVRGIDCYTSSFIFVKAIEHLNFNNCLTQDLQNFKKHNRKDLTIWGIRKEKDIYTTEYYFFYPKGYEKNHISQLTPLLKEYNSSINTISLPKDTYLISINPIDNSIDSLEYYISIINENVPIYELPKIAFRFNTKNPEFRSFKYITNTGKLILKNTYYTFFSIFDLARINKKLITFSKILFPNENPYICMEYLNLPYIFDSNNALIQPASIKIKSTNVIGLYFSDLSIDSFLKFLQFHQFEIRFIEEIQNVKQNIKHLKYDIGIDFIIENNSFTIIKVAFWGSI